MPGVVRANVVAIHSLTSSQTSSEYRLVSISSSMLLSAPAELLSNKYSQNVYQGRRWGESIRFWSMVNWVKESSKGRLFIWKDTSWQLLESQRNIPGGREKVARDGTKEPRTKSNLPKVYESGETSRKYQFCSWYPRTVLTKYDDANGRAKKSPLSITYLKSLTGDAEFALSNMATALPSSCFMSVSEIGFAVFNCSIIWCSLQRKIY